MLAKSISRARRQNMQGPAALLTAVIGQAAMDAAGIDASHYQRLTAFNYFQSQLYQHHLSHLGLPEGWLPVGVLDHMI